MTRTDSIIDELVEANGRLRSKLQIAREALEAVVGVSASGADTVAFLISLNDLAKKCASALKLMDHPDAG